MPQGNSYSDDIFMPARNTGPSNTQNSTEGDFPFSNIANENNKEKFKSVYSNSGGKHNGPYSGPVQSNPRAPPTDKDILVLLGRGQAKNTIKAYWPDTGKLKSLYKIGPKGLPNLKSKAEARAWLRSREKKGIDTNDRDYQEMHARAWGKPTTVEDIPGAGNQESENTGATNTHEMVRDQKNAHKGMKRARIKDKLDKVEKRFPKQKTKGKGKRKGGTN